MTNDQAINLIKAKIGGDDSPARNVLSQSALAVAIESACALGQFWWNSKGVLFDFVSGTGEYNLTDLFPDYEVLGIHSKLYYTANPNVCDIVSNEDFNRAFRHQMSSSGLPTFGILHGQDNTLEVWPNPNGTYETWAMLWVAVTNLIGIPSMHHGAIVARAVMWAVGADHPNYGWGFGEWNEGKDRILADKKLEIWTGSRAEPDDFVVGSSSMSKSNPNSDNLTRR